MKKVGSYEAKTHLPELLEKVAKGERITITRHGVPVGVLAPPAGAGKKPVSGVIEDIRKFRKKHKLDDISLREMITEGRR